MKTREHTMRASSLRRLLLIGLAIAAFMASAAQNTQAATPQDDLQTVTMNGIRVIKVDLRSPRIRVRTLQANGPGGTETVQSIARRWGAIAAINADYFNPTGVSSAEGLMYVDGADLTKCAPTFDCALYRRSIAFSRDNRPAIGRGRDGRSLYNVVSGGPQFMFNGQYQWRSSVQGSCASGGTGQVVINDEVFGCSASAWDGSTTVSAVGYSEDGNTLYLAASETGQTMQRMHDVLWQQGARNALRLDSGGSRTLYYNGNGGSWTLGGGRAVVNAIAILPADAVPPTSTPPPPCTPSADQVAIFSESGHNGLCKVLGIGEYSDPGAFAPVGNDDTRSIKVGANVQALLYPNAGFDPADGPTIVTRDDSDLRDNPIGYGTSSLKVQQRVPAPASPNPQSPLNAGNISSGERVSLAWSATGDSYFAEVWDDASNIQSFGWQSGTTLDIGPQLLGTYSWHVKARNQGGESSWSDTWTFTVSELGCADGEFRAQYYNSRELTGAPVHTSCESRIGNDWGDGSPASPVNVDNFSARWAGRFSFESQRYRFTARTDDGMRVWIDGHLLIDAWYDQPPTEYATDIDLTEGMHTVKVEYYENGGGATAHIGWTAVGENTATSWTPDQWQNVSHLTLDATVVRSGTRAARITSTVENDARWTQHVVVKPNTRYVLSGWIKTMQIREDLVGASLGLVDDWTRTSDIRGTHEWTYVQVVIASGEREALWIGARLGHWQNTTTGTAWFDDLALQELTPAGLGPNLLRDAGFEPPAWLPDQAEPWSHLAIDSAVAHQGAKAAQITSTSLNDARWTQLVAVKPHTSYLLSGWVKTVEVNPDTIGASLGIVDESTRTTDIRGTQDWTYLEVIVDSGSRSEIWVGARIGYWGAMTTGTVWFDDLALQELMPTGRGANLLANAGFER
jgi:hypothetical protein